MADLIPNHLTSEQTHKLLCSIKRKYHLCLILIMLDAGLRVSEAISLQVQSFDFKRRILRVQSLKKRDSQEFRTIPLSDRLFDALAEYLHERGGPHSPTDWLFPSASNPSQHIRRFAVNKLLHRLNHSKLRFAKLHPHALRHTFGTHHVAQGTPLENIRLMLGHSKYDTTLIYARVPLDNLRDNIQSVTTTPKPFWSRLWHKFFPSSSRAIQLNFDQQDLMLGRATELQTLIDYVERNINVLLLGGPGIGKSLLLRNLRAELIEPLPLDQTPTRAIALRPGLPTSDPQQSPSLNITLKRRKVLHLDDLDNLKKSLVWLLIYLFQNDKKAVQELIYGDLDLDGIRVRLMRESIGSLCSMILQNSSPQEYILTVDTADRIAPRAVDCLERLKDHFVIVVCAREVALNKGTFLWNFQTIKVDPLTRRDSFQLIDRLTNDLEAEDWDLLRNHVYEQSAGNPRVIRELCDRYHKESYLDAITIRAITHFGSLRELDFTWTIFAGLAVLTVLRYMSREVENANLRFIGGCALIALLLAKSFSKFTKRRSARR
jgi:integrase/recombinase XerD